MVSCAAILLPHAFPDLFWVWAARSAGTVVLHDTLFFDRKAHVNRGRIQTPDGPQFVYVPLRPTASGTPLHSVRMEPASGWLNALHKTLVMNYRNAVYFDFYEPEVMADFAKADEFDGFAAFASYLTGRWFAYLDVPVGWQPASALPGAPARTAAVREAVGAAASLLDPGAKNYQPRDAAALGTEGFRHPVYRHHFGFTPGCTILDLLFRAVRRVGRL